MTMKTNEFFLQTLKTNLLYFDNFARLCMNDVSVDLLKF